MVSLEWLASKIITFQLGVNVTTPSWLGCLSFQGILIDLSQYNSFVCLSLSALL